MAFVDNSRPPKKTIQTTENDSATIERTAQRTASKISQLKRIDNLGFPIDFWREPNDYQSGKENTRSTFVFAGENSGCRLRARESPIERFSNLDLLGLTRLIPTYEPQAHGFFAG